MNIKDFKNISDEELIAYNEISETDFLNSLDNEETEINEPRKPEEHIHDGMNNDFNDAQQFNQPRGDYGANNIGRKVSLNNIVSSDIAFSLIDNFLPLGVVFLLQQLDRKATKKQLQASKAEADTIKGILDKCMQQMNVDFDNPFVALGVVLAGVYGSKAVEIYITTEAEPKISKPSVHNVVKKDGRGRPRKI